MELLQKMSLSCLGSVQGVSKKVFRNTSNTKHIQPHDKPNPNSVRVSQLIID